MVTELLNRLLRDIRDAKIDLRIESDFRGFLGELRKRGASLPPMGEITASAVYVDTRLYPSADWNGFEDHIIALNREHDDVLKYFTALHEFAHFRCRTTGCTCSNPLFFHPITEVHAHRSVLDQLAGGDVLIRARYLARMGSEMVDHLAGIELDRKLLGHLIALLIKSDAARNGLAVVENDVLTEADRNGYGNYCNVIHTGPVEVWTRLEACLVDFPEQREMIDTFIRENPTA